MVDGEWMNELTSEIENKGNEWELKEVNSNKEKGGETHSHMAEFSVSSQAAESV